MLLPRLRRWFPQRVSYRAPLVRAVAEWPADEAWRVLSLTLRATEDPIGQIATAEVIGVRWRSDGTVREQLGDIVAAPTAPLTRAAALLAWLRSWGQDEEFARMISAQGNELVPEIRLVRLLANVENGDRSAGLRDAFVEALAPSGVHYAWQPLAEGALVKHWKGDLAIRDACAEAVQMRYSPVTRQLPEREHAWNILLEGFPGDDAVVEAIIRELDEPHTLFRGVDWSVLGRNFRDHPRLIERLEQWIANLPPLGDTQLAGAALVGRTALGKTALLEQLNKAPVPWWPASALLEGWGMADPDVAEPLAALAASDNPRAAKIAFLLPKIIEDPERCYERLLELLGDPAAERTDFVMAGLSDLGRVRDNPEVVRVALARLRQHRGHSDGAVIAALSLSSPSLSGVRDVAWRELHHPDGPFAAIARGFASDAEVRERVAEMLTPLPSSLRHVISEALQEVSAIDTSLTEVCRDYAWEEAPEIAAGAALAFYRGRLARGELDDTDVARLREEVGSYGPHYEERRQAAYAALLEIGRGEVVDDGHETIGDPTPFRIALGTWEGPNRVLVRQVLARWAALKERYAGAVLARLSGQRSEFTPREEHGLWEHIAPDVDGHEAAEEQLREFLRSAKDVTLGPELLGYLSRIEPRSILLREHSVRALGAQDTAGGRPFRRWETAAEILIAQFAEDKALWTELARRMSGTPSPHGYVVALARANPDHPALRSVADRLLDSPRGGPALAIFYAACAVESAGEVLALAQRHWSTDNSVGQWLFRPLVERLARDAGARAACAALVSGQAAVPQRVSLAVALAAAAPLPEEAAIDLAQMLALELSRREPASLAYDPRVGEVRPAAGILLDTLGSSPTGER